MKSFSGKPGRVEVICEWAVGRKKKNFRADYDLCIEDEAALCPVVLSNRVFVQSVLDKISYFPIF